MLLYGDSDIGKTMIVDKFVRGHPNICNQFGEVQARKVLRLQMPSKPNDGRLYAQIIDGLGHKAPYTRRGTDLEILSLRLLHQNPPRLMIVGEVQHLLAGSVREQRQSLNLETAVERARVGRDGVGWQGATTRRACARKKEQRRQQAPAWLNRVRSVLTQQVKCAVAVRAAPVA
jgi:hypothetical protein